RVAPGGGGRRGPGGGGGGEGGGGHAQEGMGGPVDGGREWARADAVGWRATCRRRRAPGMSYAIGVEDDPSPADVALLSSGLTQHAPPVTRVPGFHPLAPFAPHPPPAPPRRA